MDNDDPIEIQKQIDSIRKDTSHPWHHGDKAAQEQMDNLYRRKYGNESVNSFQPGEKERMQRDFERQWGDRKAGPQRGEPKVTEPEISAEVLEKTRQELQPVFDEVSRIEMERGEDSQEIDKAIAGMGPKVFGGDVSRLNQFIIDNDLAHNPGRLADARALLLKWAREEK